jgi:gliding motility-associatede transport system auxiliary component
VRRGLARCARAGRFPARKEAVISTKPNRFQLAETLASVGAACLIAGYLRYSIQDSLLLASKILLIAGGVLLLAGIVLGFRGILNFFSKRSSQLGANAAILTLAVVAILVVANYLGSQYHKSFDLTANKLYTLAPQTQKIVRGLKEDVNIAHFAKRPDQQLDDLLAEYRDLSHHIKFQEVDPDQKPGLARQYGATQMGEVDIASGPRTQHLEPPADGGFTEQAITSAILKVTSSTVKTVCFVSGHGEKSIADTGAHGYSQADAGLKRENYETKTINLVQSNAVPSDCTVVVVDGPTQSYFPQETAMLSKYLDNGGKALFELDPVTEDHQQPANLDSILQAWNIKLGNNVVIDASGMGRLFGAGPEIPLVVDYGSSPITKGLERTMTFFPLARTVAIADQSKLDPQSVELLKTSSRSFTTPKLAREVSYNPKTDSMGPLSLAVAASRKVGDHTARLVVFGDSDFASNEAIGQSSNGDLFLNAVDWLAADQNLISIRPKSAASRHVNLTDSQAIALRWADIFALPGVVLILGLAIWWKRR